MKKQSAFFNKGYIDTDFRFFQNDKSVTFMTWIKFLECENEFNSTILGQRNGLVGRVELYSDHDKKIILFSPSIEPNSQCSKFSIENNIWYNITLTIDAIVKKINIYIDGNLEITCGFSDFVNSPTSIGKYPETSYSFNGYMAETKFYNYAMTSDEIKNKMNKIEAKNNPQLLSYYNFEKDFLDITGRVANLDVKNVTLSNDFPSDVNSTRYLIKQNNTYHTIKSNLQPLGKPTDSIQLENWYKKYGVGDVNILTQKLNYKDTPITKYESTGIWKTDFQLDANDIIDNVQLVENENNKTIKYGCNEYRILDLVDDEFQIKMMKEI